MSFDPKDSINKLLNERLSSPFWGALISSWLIWNWKIWYLTFFIDSKDLKETKLDFIIEHLSNNAHLIYGPLISAILLTTVVPIVTNLIFWVNALYDKWRVDKRNEVDKSTVLTLDQSIALRADLSAKLEKNSRFITEKEEEMASLRKDLAEAVGSYQERLNQKEVELSDSEKLLENERRIAEMTLHQAVDEKEADVEKRFLQIDYLETENQILDEFRTIAGEIINTPDLLKQFKEIYEYLDGDDISRYPLLVKKFDDYFRRRNLILINSMSIVEFTMPGKLIASHFRWQGLWQ